MNKQAISVLYKYKCLTNLQLLCSVHSVCLSVCLKIGRNKRHDVSSSESVINAENNLEQSQCVVMKQTFFPTKLALLNSVPLLFGVKDVSTCH